MTEQNKNYDTTSTIIRQQEQEQNQQEQELRSSSRSSSAGSTSSASSTATGARACACAREADEAEAAAEARASMLHGQYVDCCEYYAASFHRGIPAGIQREIATRIKGGMSAEVIRAAIDDTMLAPRPSWAYCAAILRGCDQDGVKSLADWMARKERRQSSGNPALNYDQRHYTNDDYGPDFFFDVVKHYRQKEQKNSNPALNYNQRHYTDADYGPDFYVDLDKYS